jgi:hypothetical protein
MFSCSACDEWRIRSVHGRRHKAGSQGELRTERFRCQRAKRGKKPIRFRVIVGGDTCDNVEVSNVVTDEPAAKATPPKERLMKKRIAAKAENDKKETMMLLLFERDW